MSHHEKICVTPSHTKKVFGNIKREGKGFSGRVTPLFQTMMVQAHEEMGEGLEIPTDPHHTPIITQPSTLQPQKKQSRWKQRKDTEVLQPSGPTEPIADEAPNEENVPTHSDDPLLSGKDRLKLNELMELCTQLQNRVLNLENTKTTQAQEITSLKKRVKKLEKRKKSRTQGLKRMYKVDLSAKIISSKDEGVTLVDETQGMNDKEMFDTCVLKGEEVFAGQDMAEKEVSVVGPFITAGEVVTTVSTTTTITPKEVTLAQALMEIKTSKPKAKGIVFKEPSESTTTTPTPIVTPQQSSQVKDKGKGKMVEPDPVKKFSIKEQIRLDEEVARNLEAQLQAEEEEIIAREKQEANVALVEEWYDIQAKIKADQLLAERLQAREQEELTIDKRAKLFQ
ncbi:hypothetical protein Tco_0227401 [Tanacetum coccineum]